MSIMIWTEDIRNRFQIDNNSFYVVDMNGRPIQEGSHYYSSVHRVSCDLRHPSHNDTSDDAKYICAYDGETHPNSPVFSDWCGWIERLKKSRQLPSTILRPELYCTMDGYMPGYVARLPVGLSEDTRIKRNLVRDDGLLMELYVRGLMDATSVELTPYNVFINPSDYSVFVDTMPGTGHTRWQDMNSFLQHYDRYLDSKYNWRLMKRPQDIFVLVSDLVDRKYQAPDGKRGIEPGGVQMMVTFPEPAQSRFDSGKTGRKIIDCAPGDARNFCDLSETFPKQPLFEIQRHSDSRLMLRNESSYTWVSCRYSGMRIKPREAFAPRKNESISIELPNDTRITMFIKGFTESVPTTSKPMAARHASAQVNHTPAQHPAPKQVVRTANPAPKREVPVKTSPVKDAVLQKPVQPAVRAEAKPLSEFYDYDATKLPPLNHSIPATDRATGRRVMLEHLSDSPAGSYDMFMEIRKNPPPRVDGLCELLKLHRDKSGSDFILVREAPASEGWYPANYPALRKLSREQLFRAAEVMMRLLDGVLAHRWVPTRFIETHMLIDPRTLEARFLDGAWLSREGRAPLECTLGYRAPEAYASTHRATMPDVSFCAAVWLYRLLIGGYPMEGRLTRRTLSEANGATEVDIAPQLYGEKALFVFDPNDQRNAIDGLGGAFDEQCGHWQAMPEALREAWRTTFSTCLHKDIFGRVTPAKWAELLRGELQKGGR